jgi:hypothetical protein
MSTGPANKAWVPLNVVLGTEKATTTLSADPWTEAMILHMRGETALIVVSGPCSVMIRIQ